MCGTQGFAVTSPTPLCRGCCPFIGLFTSVNLFVVVSFSSQLNQEERDSEERGKGGKKERRKKRQKGGKEFPVVFLAPGPCPDLAL